MAASETIDGWLLKLADGPILRDANRDGIPFHVATEMMKSGLIEPGIELSRALAKMTWRVWNITPAGLQRTRASRRPAGNYFVRG